jgi:WD40 repeat protein
VQWDPRGTGIYYGEAESIRRVVPLTGESSRVYQSSANSQITTDLTNFEVSPDGTAIAFIAQSASGRSIRILTLADGHVMDRHTFRHECRAVAWSRDGQRLLVSGSESETLQPSLFVMDVAGGEPRPLNVKTEYIVEFSLRHDVHPAESQVGWRCRKPVLRARECAGPESNAPVAFLEETYDATDISYEVQTDTDAAVTGDSNTRTVSSTGNAHLVRFVPGQKPVTVTPSFPLTFSITIVRSTI